MTASTPQSSKILIYFERSSNSLSCKKAFNVAYILQFLSLANLIPSSISELEKLYEEYMLDSKTIVEACLDALNS